MSQKNDSNVENLLVLFLILNWICLSLRFDETSVDSTGGDRGSIWEIPKTIFWKPHISCRQPSDGWCPFPSSQRSVEIHISESNKSRPAFRGKTVSVKERHLTPNVKTPSNGSSLRNRSCVGMRQKEHSSTHSIVSSWRQHQKRNSSQSHCVSPTMKTPLLQVINQLYSQNWMRHKLNIELTDFVLKNTDSHRGDAPQTWDVPLLRLLFSGITSKP